MPVVLSLAGFVLLVSTHLWVMVEDSRDEVRLAMLDVGLGQSLVISVPGGHRWLVDGGGGSSHFDLGEAVVAPVLSHGRPPRIDGAFMTHPDVDHSHGLPYVMGRFDSGPLYTNGMMPGGSTGRRLRAVMDRQGTEPVPLCVGDVIRLDEHTVLRVLHPSGDFRDRKANERSLVLKLERDGKPLALLPGDVENHGINALLAGGADLRAELLLLPHHGSRSSLSPEFYGKVSPEVVLCSDGYLNRYGFPHSTVIEAVGVPVWNTALHGRVDVIWERDGERTLRAFSP